VLDHGLLDRALEAEIELLEGLAGGEAGGLDPVLAAVLSRAATSVPSSISAKRS
jgi:hypothetical protein